MQNLFCKECIFWVDIVDKRLSLGQQDNASQWPEAEKHLTLWKSTSVRSSCSRSHYSPSKVSTVSFNKAYFCYISNVPTSEGRLLRVGCRVCRSAWFLNNPHWWSGITLKLLIKKISLHHRAWPWSPWRFLSWLSDGNCHCPAAWPNK